MQDAIKALAKAQTEMGKALKNANNPHLKSKYADLGAVMDACFSALHANGFAVMQPCGRDEAGQYVETHLAHESGHVFISRVHLVVGKNDMQGVGSAITYARRYGLLGMAGLAPEDDDGEATKAQPRQIQKQADAPRQIAKPEPNEADALRNRMVAGLREKGAGLADFAPFKADLERLRKLSAELAASVEAEIETQKQGAAA
jgi:hypothetical protein